ncbi:hypothetical protein Tco_1105739 [Tanacetum coccineum]
MSQAKEAQIKFYKTREDKELDKIIALENKVKFLKKAQRANPRLYDTGCYNYNLALILAPESDETIRLDKESRSKLSDLIRPFDYDQLNNLYDLFVLQQEKSPEQHYFPRTSKMSHTSSNNEFSKESFGKQTTLLAKRMDESIPWDQKCKSSKELFKIKKSVDTIFDGVERCNQTIAKRTYFGVIPLLVLACTTLKSNQLEDRVMSNNSQGKKQEVEDHRRNFKFSNNKTSVTACTDSLNAKTSHVTLSVVTCGKCVLNDNHDLCVLHYINGVSYRTRQPMAVPISPREPKHNVNQFVATSSKKTVATDSTIKKSRHITKKLYDAKLVRHAVGGILRTVKFGNDQIVPILGYGDLGNDLLTGSRGTYLYSITLQNSTTPNPICLMAKATSSQACEYSLELLPIVLKSSLYMLLIILINFNNITQLTLQSTHQTPTQVPSVTAPEIIQAETNTENAQFDEDEFINIFSTPVQEQGETLSRHVDSSNMHTFYQHHPSAQRWTKDIIRTSNWNLLNQLEQDVS